MLSEKTSRFNNNHKVD